MYSDSLLYKTKCHRTSLQDALFKFADKYLVKVIAYI